MAYSAVLIPKLEADKSINITKSETPWIGKLYWLQWKYLFQNAERHDYGKELRWKMRITLLYFSQHRGHFHTDRCSDCRVSYGVSRPFESYTNRRDSQHHWLDNDRHEYKRSHDSPRAIAHGTGLGHGNIPRDSLHHRSSSARAQRLSHFHGTDSSLARNALDLRQRSGTGLANGFLGLPRLCRRTYDLYPICRTGISRVARLKGATGRRPEGLGLVRDFGRQ